MSSIAFSYLHKKPPDLTSDKNSFIRLPVYRDPESGLTGFNMDNHASIVNPAAVTTDMATSTETPYTQTQRLSPPSTITTTTIHDTQLQREALNVMRTNAGQGILSAMLDLGGLYYHGEGGALQNFSRAMQWFTQAAEDHGSHEAQYNIGTMYHQGHGVIHNFETALGWYQRAAAQGNTNAQYSIGLLYLHGEGVAQDFVRAWEWFLKSANQGNPSAQIAVGNMLFHGLGVPQRYDLALDWYLQAADQGSAAAQANIGIMYLNGLGVLQDQQQAMEWLIRAAQGGDASAQRYLERHQEPE
ncbi:hypothetical protein F5H01DRAFT_29907 [Linnemannia elongata]|nr:hypothetical protein F5H01DRAFT_29907 [Linnemannia elongata]